MPRLKGTLEKNGFNEVNRGLTGDQVLEEASRCFSCGVCDGCDNCWIFCPDVAIHRKDGIYTIDYDYCKGCLVCMTECPRGCISVESEGK
jgi:Pyruvate/2-oxoacid:ferredoxin oxidoreductase delta subunit